MVQKFTGFRMEGDSEETDGTPGRPFCAIGPIAIVPLNGIIGRHLPLMERLCMGGCDLGAVDMRLRAAAEAEEITQVVLACNSPGGSAVGTPETAALFREIGESKPTIAYTDKQCCSGAYYVASQAGQIFCAPSAWLGSIGVRSIFLDKTMQLATEGVKTNVIGSGKWKNVGAAWKEMTPEERALLQSHSDHIYAAFCAAVSTARPQIAAESMEGQSFIGEEAIGAGLADGLVNSLDDLVSTLLLDC